MTYIHNRNILPKINVDRTPVITKNYTKYVPVMIPFSVLINWMQTSLYKRLYSTRAKVLMTWIWIAYQETSSYAIYSNSESKIIAQLVPPIIPLQRKEHQQLVCAQYMTVSSSSSFQTRIMPKRWVPRLKLICPPSSWPPHVPYSSQSIKKCLPWISWRWRPNYVFLFFRQCCFFYISFT